MGRNDDILSISKALMLFSWWVRLTFGNSTFASETGTNRMKWIFIYLLFTLKDIFEIRGISYEKDFHFVF